MPSTSFLHCVCYLTIFFFLSCKKTESTDNPPNRPPAVTPIGTPVGNPVSKTLGAGGGSLLSPDGKLELTIPVGALSSSTSISIQPVTNEAPGGIGLSYHLMPDGIKFLKPVTLVYHYSDQDINGTLPFLLYIAYQDSLRQWKADFKKRDVDTIAKTVSLDISHFSIWSMGSRLLIVAFPGELRKEETSDVRAVFQSPPESSAGSDDELPPLPSISVLNDVSNWKVNGQLNGNSQNGTISGTGGKVSYKAPSTIAQERTVQLSAEVKYNISEYNNGHLVASAGKFILFREITLLPESFEFHLQIAYNRSIYLSSSTTLLYTDKTDMDLSVNGNNVTVSNITNTPLSITPSSSVALGLCTYTFLPGTNGYLNVTSGTGYVGTDQNNQKIFGVQLGEVDCYEPGYDLSCPPSSPGSSQHVDPVRIPATYIGQIFFLKDSAQVITYDPNGEERTIYRLTVR